MRIFFQSSLPRSGSTLLQNLMGQNPDFYVTPTSGVLELFYGARGTFSTSPEFKAQDQIMMEAGFKNFCAKGLLGFFEPLADKKYVLDKSRGWGIHYNFLNWFYPDPKIICMVRDPRDIYASMERLFRENQQYDHGIINHASLSGTTTLKRIETWSRTAPIGLAMERLQQIMAEGIDRKLLFIRYEDLSTNPEQEMDRIYHYLGIPRFKHTFTGIEQVTQEDDAIYGNKFHEIRPDIEANPSRAIEILGPDNCNKIYNTYKWFYDRFR